MVPYTPGAEDGFIPRPELERVLRLDRTPLLCSLRYTINNMSLVVVSGALVTVTVYTARDIFMASVIAFLKRVKTI